MNNAYDVKKGRYWSAPGPDGDFIVFWHHPDDGKIHHQVAIFFDADRAARYVGVENGFINPDEPPVCSTEELLAGTYLKPNVQPYYPERTASMTASQFDTLCARVRGDLPKLFDLYPKGITTKNIMDDYGAPYDRACQVLRFLETAELGQYVFVNGKGGAKIFVRPGVEIALKELTYQQEAVLDVMRHVADSYGLVCLPALRLATDAHVSPGSISTILIALEKKGFLMLAKPSGGPGGAPATYQITEKTMAKVVEEMA